MFSEISYIINFLEDPNVKYVELFSALNREATIKVMKKGVGILLWI